MKKKISVIMKKKVRNYLIYHVCMGKIIKVFVVVKI